HKTQPKARKLTKEEAQQYILSQWISEDFLTSDLRPSNQQQSIVYTDPQFTFLEKFLEKRQQRLVVWDLLIQGLLPLNSIKPSTYMLNFSVLSSHHLNIISDIVQKKLYEDGYNYSKKTLTPQSTQLITTTTEVPMKFVDLLESEIFNNESIENSSTRKTLWEEFALWSCFAVGPKIVKQFRHHCYLLWSKETTKMVASGINLKGYRHIFKPQCFLNIFGETIVDFFDIDKKSARESEIAVDNYFKHMLDNPRHQSIQFKSDLIKYFGCFTDSNNLPYTTINTASSHNKAHQKCVQDLIRRLQPLSGAINKYLETNYSALYFKMKSLNLGPNLGWDSNNEEAKSSQTYTSLKLGSQKPKTKIKNHQRSHLNLKPAKIGLPAEYKKLKLSK
ncbi:24622_t:CDS:2, partial [Gigaspora rosea]